MPSVMHRKAHARRSPSFQTGVCDKLASLGGPQQDAIFNDRHEAFQVAVDKESRRKSRPQAAPAEPGRRAPGFPSGID